MRSRYLHAKAGDIRRQLLLGGGILSAELGIIAIACWTR